ncbi:MAG: nucleoside diphosphate kinase regulator [Mesorhizobium sp.]
MAANKKTKPAIALSRDDHARLSVFAGQMADGPLADELYAELDRARIIAPSKVLDTVVRMGSTVRYSTDLGENRVVTLVYPGEADIAQGKISVLTPIGVALIGLSEGQSIDWTARDNRTHRLTIDQVLQTVEPDVAA